MKNNKNKCGKLFVLLAVSLMMMVLLTGCTKPVEEASSQPVVSEEVSEVVSEEVGEEISEATSEEVEEIDLSLYTTVDIKRPVDLINDMDYEELKIVVWGHIDEEISGAKAILSDGDSYTIVEDDNLYLYYAEQNSSVHTDKDYVYLGNDGETYSFVFLNIEGTNLEVPITAIAPDGTEYSITVYITNE